MARSLNKVVLLGNVGSDPEVRTTQNALKVGSFSLATSQQWNDAQGTKQEKTQWHRCVAWNTARGGLADIVEKYVRKGEKLYVEGEVEYREWNDKDGVKRYTTEIKVREIILLGGKNSGNSDAGPGAPAARSNRAPNKAERTRDSDNFDDFPGALQDEDDDLPF